MLYTHQSAKILNVTTIIPSRVCGITQYFHNAMHPLVCSNTQYNLTTKYSPKPEAPHHIFQPAPCAALYISGMNDLAFKDLHC
jgi:hypothetical protein